MRLTPFTKEIPTKVTLKFHELISLPNTQLDMADFIIFNLERMIIKENKIKGNLPISINDENNLGLTEKYLQQIMSCSQYIMLLPIVIGKYFTKR